MLNYEEITEEIPDYERFLTVDELNESSAQLATQYPDVVELKEIGRSRQGDPIKALFIGEGEKTALLFATPHPNEPIGAMTLEFLSRELAEDRELREELGFKWIIVKCSDPDGTRLNEGWFDGPFTPLNYAKNFYRPPGFQQVEWTFPVQYKDLDFADPIPETEALMTIIEEEKPNFIYSLHNAGFGGAYYYVSGDCEPLYDSYRKAATDQDIPLHLGEPEMPYAEQLSDAVYLMPSIKESYDYLEEYTDKDPAEVIKAGTGSTDYARRFLDDFFSLVCEVPYFYDSRIEDMSDSDVQRKRAVLDSADISDEMFDFLQESYERIEELLTVDSKFKDAVEENMRVMKQYSEAKRSWANSNEELESPATVSQKFDNYVVTRFYRMLSFGMFLRMLDDQLEESSGEAAERLRQVRNEVNRELERQNELLLDDLQYEVIPIRKLVAVQLVAGLASVAQLND